MEIPPRVEYELTELGRTLTGPIMALHEWVESHMTEIDAARAHHDSAIASRPNT